MRTYKHILLTLLCIGLPALANAAWEDGFPRQYYAPIVIQHEKIPADVTNFVVPFDETNLPTSMMDTDESDVAQSGGGGIRFSSSDPIDMSGSGVTQIPCDIIYFVPDSDPASADVEIHVNVPSISSDTDTTIWVAWGNSDEVLSQPAAGSAYGSESVWPSNYKLASHDGGMTDSTEYGNDGTEIGGVSGGGADGVFGVSTDFDGTDDHLLVSDDPSLDLLAHTIYFWAYLDDNGDQGIITRGVTFGAANARDIDLAVYDNKYKYIGTNGGAAIWNLTSTDNVSTGAWVFCVYRWDGTDGSSGVKLFIDNVEQDTGASSVSGGLVSAHDFLIGASAGAYAFNGKIDEVVIIAANQTDDWATALYNSQSSPSTFAVPGTIVDPPVTTKTLIGCSLQGISITDAE